jgi:hypothetical protein
MLTIKCYDLIYENNQITYKKLTYDEDKLIDESYNLVSNQHIGSLMTDDGILCGTHFYQRLSKASLNSSSGNNFDFETQRKKEINALAMSNLLLGPISSVDQSRFCLMTFKVKEAR